MFCDNVGQGSLNWTKVQTKNFFRQTIATFITLLADITGQSKLIWDYVQTKKIFPPNYCCPHVMEQVFIGLQ